MERSSIPISMPVLSELHAIVALGNAKVVKEFLKIKPDVDVNERSEPTGLTPLHINVSGLTDDDDRQEIIKLLHRAGADLEARSQQGEGITPLQRAATRGKPRCVATLIALGANIHATESMGATALHGAAFLGYREDVTALLAAGADPTLPDKEGNTPLSLAQARGHSEIRELLRAAATRRLREELEAAVGVKLDSNGD